MTDILPYVSKKREGSIAHAIGQKELPADLPNIPMPDFVKEILTQCWVQAPEARPTMSWIRGTLLKRSPSLFRAFLNSSFETIPPQYKDEGPGYQVIRNPDSEMVFSWEVLETIDLTKEVPYVFYSTDALPCCSLALLRYP